MDGSSLTNRRRFLEGAGLGGTILLAGCAEQFGVGDDGQSEADGDGLDGVAAIAEIDQQAMQKEQVEIQQQVANGELNQTEAQEAMIDVQETYVGEAVDALTGTIEDADGVEVGETYSSLGAVTVTGEPADVLGLLGSEDVRALVSAADVEEQAQARNG